MRSIYNGTVSFGLVNVGVKLYSATESHELTGHQVHTHDGGRIKYAKVCSTCDETVSDLSKAYEIDGQVAILSDDDLADLPGSTSRVIEVLEFVQAGEVDPLMLDKPYYLGLADAKSSANAKAYALLARTLSNSGLVAIVEFNMRGKNHLATIKATGKSETLVLHTLRWADELREPEFSTLDTTVHERARNELSDAELKMAGTLVESMTATWEPGRYQDTYQTELRELVMSKLGDAPDSGEEEVSDLLAKLAASTAAKAPVQQACKPNIREWAKSRGLKVGVRGRIPQDIVDRYERESASA